MLRRIDLNADLGESCGDDAAMLELVTSANIATGGHAGGGETLRETLNRAIELNVRIGAHPSYLDRENFGRTSHADSVSRDELVAHIVSQLRAFDAAVAGRVDVAYVKAHGALYNDAMARADIAQVLLDALDQWNPQRDIAVMGLPNSVLSHAADGARHFITEGFADRAYLADGSLMPRSQPGAVLADLTGIKAQALRLATTVDSICIHGDTPNAVEMARQIRAELESAGFDVTA